MGNWPCNAIVPPGGGSAYGEGPYGEGLYGEGLTTGGFEPIQYYLGLLTSQYKASSNLNALLALFCQPFMDVMMCLCGLPGAFNINPALGPLAIGPQLDILGTLIGASRTLPFQPVGVNATTTDAVTSTGSHTVTVNNTAYMQIGVAQTITGSDSHTESVTPTAIVQGVSFTAVFAQTHVNTSTVTTPAPSPVLSDANYQVLLQAKILQNQWNGQAGSLWQPWQTIFPGGQIFVTDNQNMTCTIFLIGAFNPIVQQMITNGLIIPRPEAVAYIYEFGALPIYGWGNVNPTFVQGWGTGSGSYPGGYWGGVV